MRASFKEVTTIGNGAALFCGVCARDENVLDMFRCSGLRVLWGNKADIGEDFR